MSEIFDPAFDISFNTQKDIDSLIAAFKENFRPLITADNRWMVETADNYIVFNTDKAHGLGLSAFPYILRVSGKQRVEDAEAQEKQKAFARTTFHFLKEQGCAVEFSASFSIEIDQE